MVCPAKKRLPSAHTNDPGNILARKVDYSTKGTFTGRGRIALLPFWALFWVKNPFCNRDFWNSPFSMQEIPLSALFWGFMALLLNHITAFIVRLLSEVSSAIGILWNFRRYAPIFLLAQLFPSGFHVLACKFKKKVGALILGMVQTSLDPLLLLIFLYFLAAKVFFHAENSFIFCFNSPVLKLKSPFSEKYFGPFALFWKREMSGPVLLNTWIK